jgi:hypothetical protein
MTAAISAARSGASVVVLERMPKPGKKVLATGAGRCNLSNAKLDASFYNPEARALVESVFKCFGPSDILDFFRELGLEFFQAADGRIFPVTDQAASVVEVLEIELARLGVTVECQAEAERLIFREGSWKVQTKGGRHWEASRVILCGGGKSYPALGSDGSAYALAAGCGHTLITPVPGTVPLAVSDPWCHLLQGQRLDVQLTSMIEGKPVRTVPGEMLFTKYGLSGTAVLDASDEISTAIHRRNVKDIRLVADLVPFLSEEKLREELSRRKGRGFPKEKFLTGLLPPKFGPLLAKEFEAGGIDRLARLLKARTFTVTGTRGWNEAEFTAGGIDASEVTPGTLESKKQKGLYLAGEILDVNGRRGGYNLAWAWASGFVAGKTL